jgi:hypothetical protein
MLFYLACVIDSSRNFIALVRGAVLQQYGLERTKSAFVQRDEWGHLSTEISSREAVLTCFMGEFRIYNPFSNCFHTYPELLKRIFFKVRFWRFYHAYAEGTHRYIDSWYVRWQKRAEAKTPIIVKMHFVWRHLRFLKRQWLEMLFLYTIKAPLSRCVVNFQWKSVISRHIRCVKGNAYRNDQYDGILWGYLVQLLLCLVK